MSAVTTTTTKGAGAVGGLPTALFGYEILESIGRGAGSTIYAATHPQTRQLCALKHVVATNEKEQRFVDQLRAEYEVGQKVGHGGLRKGLDLKGKTNWLGEGAEAGRGGELVDGVPLDQECPSDLMATLDCFIEVAHALHALHGL